MKFKELRKKVELYLHTEEKLKNINVELNITQSLLYLKNQQLNELKKQIDQEREQLQETKEKINALKVEKEELKDFINQSFLEEYKDYDYKVDITNCYVIELRGKRYITLRKCTRERTGLKSLATGTYNIEDYNYYDVLNLNKETRKYRHIHHYRYGYFDNAGYFAPTTLGNAPDYEERLLTLYPELSVFYDNFVPNTYLKKIYYEINNLNNNPILNRARVPKQES